MGTRDFADRFVTIDAPLTAFDLVTAEVTTLLAVADNAGGGAVPLDGWSAVRLRQHFVETLAEYTAAVEGAPPRPPGSPVPTDLPHRAADFRAAAARARDAFARPGALTAVWRTQIGPQPGAAVLQHVLNELISHAWDLARSVDRTVALPDALVGQCQASWRAFFETFGRPEVNFGPERAAPAGASAADRLAAYLGRTV